MRILFWLPEKNDVKDHEMIVKPNESGEGPMVVAGNPNGQRRRECVQRGAYIGAVVWTILSALLCTGGFIYGYYTIGSELTMMNKYDWCRVSTLCRRLPAIIVGLAALHVGYLAIAGTGLHGLRTRKSAWLCPFYLYTLAVHGCTVLITVIDCVMSLIRVCFGLNHMSIGIPIGYERACWMWALHIGVAAILLLTGHMVYSAYHQLLVEEHDKKKAAAKTVENVA